MSVLNNTTVNGVVTQTLPASQTNHLVRLAECQTILASLFQGEWNNTTTFTAGQMVTDSGALYIANQNSLNQRPSLNTPTIWRLAAAAGADGVSSFNYTAYASDTSGTGFSLTPGSGLSYVAFLTSPTAIGSPQASDFTGLWKRFVGTDGTAGNDGINGQTPYFAFASDASGTGFSLTPAVGLNYLAFKLSATALTQASDFAGLWAKYIGSDGATGATGATGADGQAAYFYIAYASDTSGAGFSLTPGSGLNYVAFRTTTTPIASPAASDFTGLWKSYANPFTVTSPLVLSGGVLSVNASSAATANYLVQRDASGNFSGAAISGTTFVVGGASTLSIVSGALNVSTGVVTTALTVGSLSGILKAAAGVVAGSATTDDLTEGATNQYFTAARVRTTTLTGLTSTNVILATDTVLSAFGKLDNVLGGNFPSGTVTGNFTITGNLAVTGTTTLATSLTGLLKATSGLVSGSATTDDLTEGATNLYFTNARADARITAQKGANSGIAPLDSSGKVPLANLYAYGATTYGAASQSAMLALSSAKQGDICLRSDTNVAYILTNNTPSILSNWSAWVYPVVSVNGATGAITLTTDNVGEGTTNLYFTNARADARITASRGAANGICPLDASQLVPAANLPPIGNSIWIVNSQSTQTGLSSALKGDIANRTDQNLSYVLSNNTPTSFASWVPLLYPVSSVNGATGTVVLTTTNITEGTNLYFTNARAIAATLTGYTSGAGTISSADTVLSAIQKLNGNVAAITLSNYLALAGGTMTGALQFSGTSNRGIVVNQLSTSQIGSLATTAGFYGNLVYDTSLNQLKALVNGSWVSLAAGASLPLSAGSGAPLTNTLYFQDGLATNIYFGSTWSHRTSNSNGNFDILQGGTVVLTCDTSNNVTIPNGVLKIQSHQVVGAQQSAIPDFSPAGGWTDGTAYSDFSNLTSKINSVLYMLRNHGLIAT